ncbi:MAG TPA: gamma-glutamylcyclotransferase family protein [Longimicrobiales bacterium]|nr:gamma-glutamylcyclotransferase family protein [Longimicrobiales bacterium]
MTDSHTHFNLFVYGTLRRGGSAVDLLKQCTPIGMGTVGGVLYNIDNLHPALVLYGASPVEGDVWKCPVGLLSTLDQYEGVSDGLFRRVGVTVMMELNEVPAWTYTAGPALSRKLVPSQRISSWPIKSL